MGGVQVFLVAIGAAEVATGIDIEDHSRQGNLFQLDGLKGADTGALFGTDQRQFLQLRQRRLHITCRVLCRQFLGKAACVVSARTQGSENVCGQAVRFEYRGAGNVKEEGTLIHENFVEVVFHYRKCHGLP